MCVCVGQVSLTKKWHSPWGRVSNKDWHFWEIHNADWPCRSVYRSMSKDKRVYPTFEIPSYISVAKIEFCKKSLFPPWFQYLFNPRLLYRSLPLLLLPHYTKLNWVNIEEKWKKVAFFQAWIRANLKANLSFFSPRHTAHTHILRHNLPIIIRTHLATVLVPKAH